MGYIRALQTGGRERAQWGSRDWEKNSEMQQQIEVKTFFFFFREHLDFGRKTGKSEMKSK